MWIGTPNVYSRCIGGGLGGGGFGGGGWGRGLWQPYGHPPFEIMAGPPTRSISSYSPQDFASDPAMDGRAYPTPADRELMGSFVYVSRGLREAADTYDSGQGDLRALARSKGDKLVGYLSGKLSWFGANAGIEVMVSRGAPAGTPKTPSQIYRDLADKLDALVTDAARGFSGSCTGGWSSGGGFSGSCTGGWSSGRGLGVNCGGGWSSGGGFGGGCSISYSRGFAAVIDAAHEGLIAA